MAVKTSGPAHLKRVRAMADRKAFTEGSLSAVTHDVFSTGRMSVEEAARYGSMAPVITYTVLSFSTPVAWVTLDGEVHYTTDRHSVTTSQHIAYLRAYL